MTLVGLEASEANPLPDLVIMHVLEIDVVVPQYFSPRTIQRFFGFLDFLSDRVHELVDEHLLSWIAKREPRVHAVRQQDLKPVNLLGVVVVFVEKFDERPLARTSIRHVLQVKISSFYSQEPSTSLKTQKKKNSNMQLMVCALLC